LVSIDLNKICGYGNGFSVAFVYRDSAYAHTRVTCRPYAKVSITGVVQNSVMYFMDDPFALNLSD